MKTLTMYAISAVVLGSIAIDGWSQAARMRGTSDLSQAVVQPPNPAGLVRAPGRYVAPMINIYPKFMTNIRPLVVEVTISSNVEQMTIWWDEGQVRTNFSTLASNVISVATNQVVP